MVSTVLLCAPTVTDPAHTKAILKEAPNFLRSQLQTFSLPYPLSLLINNESQEKWAAYENILTASIKAGDDAIAQQCVQALTDRFGKLNERVLIAQGLYDEMIAKDDQELARVLKKYDDVISESPTMFGLRKRRVALLKSLGRLGEAVASLVEILDNSPTDAEAWAELSDIYASQGNMEKALFCLEEVLLIMPNAWNIQAKVGELLLAIAATQEGAERLKTLSESVRRFSRSAELCGTYLRAYYGLKVSTGRLIDLLSARSDGSTKNAAVDSSILPLATVMKLNLVATARLTQIVRESKSGNSAWNGYSEAEVGSAQALLAADDKKQPR